MRSGRPPSQCTPTPTRPSGALPIAAHVHARSERCKGAPPLFLASASPRRRQLLADAGVAFTPINPTVDDGALTPGAVAPEILVMALAYLKARSGAARLAASDAAQREPCIVLGADTIVVRAGAVLGQPASKAAAADMLRSLRAAEHTVLTGVSLLALDDASAVRRRMLRFDAARVRVGPIADAEIEPYVASGAWQGKAGAYNFAERLGAGWPLECEGDVATVMGLPMRLLPHWIDELATPALQREEIRW